MCAWLAVFALDRSSQRLYKASIEAYYSNVICFEVTGKYCMPSIQSQIAEHALLASDNAIISVHPAFVFMQWLLWPSMVET